MMLARASLPLLLLFLASVDAMCDQRFISDFLSLWNNNPPTDIMEWIVGTSTYVWMTENLLRYDEDPSKLVCLQTIVENDKQTARDEIRIGDSANLTVINYAMLMKDPGIYTIIDAYQYDQFMYVLFRKNDVISYFQCMRRGGDYYTKKYPNPYPASGILVRNYDPKSDTQAQDIESAKHVLSKLKLDFDFVQLNTDCP